MPTKSIISLVVLLLCVITVVNCAQEVVMQYKKNITITCPNSANSDVVFYRKPKPANSTDGSTTDFQEIKADINFRLDKDKLTIKEIRRDELESEYSCKAANGRDEHFVVKHAPALYKPEKQSQTITEGGFSTMSCKMLFGDRDDRISSDSWEWYRNDEVIESVSNRYEITSENTQTTLTVHKVDKTDKGQYKCTLKNRYGTAEETIILRVKDVFAALWPFLAILGEVFVLCVIILIYEKKFAKKKNPEEEQGEASQNLMGKDTNADTRKRNTRS